MLDVLASPIPEPQLLEDPQLANHPALQAFARRSWATRRQPVPAGGAPALVLLTAYQTGLYIEAVRRGYRHHIVRGGLLFLARSVWPAYQVWVTGAHPLATRPSVRSSVSWLTGDGMLSRALRELEVCKPEAPEFRLFARDFTQNETTYRKWFERARGEVHTQVMDQLKGVGLHGEQIAA
jgi:hypothetical protein